MKVVIELEDNLEGKVIGSLIGKPLTGSLLDYVCEELVLALPSIVKKALKAHDTHAEETQIKPTIH